jgi:molybdenum cofactor synthesis domain-containing protein
MRRVRELCGAEPLLRLLPYKLKKAAIIATGSEVYTGRIKDTFTPVIVEKLAEYGVEVVYKTVLGDDDRAVTEAIRGAIEERGAELVCCTGGMSVDPDDRTPLAIKNSGARIVSYGAPVLPGAMFLLAYYGERSVPIMGLPGCVMYAKRTIFDLVLPRVLACDPVTSDELASLGEGGLCLNCPVCTYPACGFGKGW